jgi:hypothetical protein
VKGLHHHRRHPHLRPAAAAAAAAAAPATAKPIRSSFCAANVFRFQLALSAEGQKKLSVAEKCAKAARRFSLTIISGFEWKTSDHCCARLEISRRHQSRYSKSH